MLIINCLLDLENIQAFFTDEIIDNVTRKYTWKYMYVLLFGKQFYTTPRVSMSTMFVVKLVDVRWNAIYDN